MFGLSGDWTTLLPLSKTLSTSHFQLCRLFKQSVWQCTRYRVFRNKCFGGVSNLFRLESSGTLSSSSKKVETHWRSISVYMKFWRIFLNSGCFEDSELVNILAWDVKGENFAKTTEKLKNLGHFSDKVVKISDGHVWPKTRDLFNPKAEEEFWIHSSYAFKHKSILHCAERKAKMFGNWALQPLKLWFLCCEMCCQYLRN